MKIAYIGNFGPEHSTENHYARSFRELGHTVIQGQEPAREEDWPAFFDATRTLLDHERPSLLLYTRTWGLPKDEGYDLWHFAEDRGAVTAAVHLDRWEGLDREHEVREQPMFGMGYVFTADGDAQAMYEAAGVNHHWLRPGVLGAECYDAEPIPEFEQYAVAFVGSAPTARGGNYHHEWGHRRELVAKLAEWYGPNFVHVGNGGTVGTLRGDLLNRFYASVPVIVGDSCLVRPDGRYWSDRVYETWGRGGFLIHPRVDALAEEIGDYPGMGWVPGDWEALSQIIAHWIDGRWSGATGAEWSTTRARIASVVRTRCTYTNRAREMLGVMGLT